jgi:UDP-3-O-[3-hydroxymyristoyl] glucosamine N-acyltransferase
MTPSGEFAVAWSDWYGKTWVQTFDADGVCLSKREVDSGGGDPAITASPNGDYVVVWEGWHRGLPQILGQRFTSAGGEVVEPRVVVFAGATIGPGATVETGARIGRLATVSPGAVVPAGTTVPAGTVFP